MDINLLTDRITSALSFLTVVGGVVFIFGILYLIVRKKFSILFLEKVIVYVGERANIFVGLLALISSSSSLYYSEIAHYNPCKLCWYQRVFMYPIVLISLYGFLKNEKNSIKYSTLLASIGAPIALYHYLMQISVVPVGDCAVVGYSESCASTFFLEYGYVTIPIMALTVFLLIILLNLFRNLVTPKN